MSTLTLAARYHRVWSQQRLSLNGRGQPRFYSRRPSLPRYRITTRVNSFRIVHDVLVLWWMLSICVARECRGCRCTPRATKKSFIGIFVDMRQKWGSIWWGAPLPPADEMKRKLVAVYYARFFWSRKVHPHRENPGYAYGVISLVRFSFSYCSYLYIELSVCFSKVFVSIPVIISESFDFPITEIFYFRVRLAYTTA